MTQVEGDGGRRPRLQQDLVEPPQHLDGRALGDGVRGQRDVELGDRRAGDGPGVPDAGGHADDGLPELRVASGGVGRGGVRRGRDVVDELLDLQRRLQAEGGVAQTEAELVQGIDAVGVQPPVVYQEALGEVGLPGRGRRDLGLGEVDDGDVRVSRVDGDGVGQPAGGVHVAPEDVDDGVPRLLAREMGRQDGRDVGVAGPRQRVDAGRVRHDDGVGAPPRHVVDDQRRVPVGLVARPVVGLGREGVEEDEADLGHRVEAAEVAGGQHLVAQDVLHAGAGPTRPRPDGLERRDEVRVPPRAGPAADGEGADLEAGAKDQPVGRIGSVVAKDANVGGVPERQGGAVDVLEEDGRLGAQLPDEVRVVAPHVAARRRVEGHEVEQVRLGGDGVGDGRVDGRVVGGVLVKEVVLGHDEADHVVEAGLGDGAVPDHASDVGPPVGLAGEGLGVADGAGHVHVEPVVDGVCARVGGEPVGHDVAVKGQLRLEHVVQQGRVLAGVRLVQAVVAAHDARDAGADGVGKGPEVQLVQGAVVHVGGDGGDLGAVGEPRVGPLGLLLVADQVLGAGLHAGVLHALDGEPHGDAREVRVDREALPVAAAQRLASKGSGDRAVVVEHTHVSNKTRNVPEPDVDALVAELVAQGPAALVDELLIPAGGRGEPRGEDADEVGAVEGRGAVEQAEAREADAVDRGDVADAAASLKPEPASDHARLFRQVEPGHKGGRLGDGRLPVPDWRGWRGRRRGWRSSWLCWMASWPAAGVE
ncbi:hypothetical protein CTA1_6920 [Colletotrichum tanaceti]|uniref:Uncharacterized protein n=1 Tax=Colletotrichum tanaceti TaxID=1306861 RepID=A0A4U6XKJ9_9PEZI|nr:hypothetical protein CTA1_6920 [Colletotrichum tanaceti]